MLSNYTRNIDFPSFLCSFRFERENYAVWIQDQLLLSADAADNWEWIQNRIENCTQRQNLRQMGCSQLLENAIRFENDMIWNWNADTKAKFYGVSKVRKINLAIEIWRASKDLLRLLWSRPMNSIRRFSVQKFKTKYAKFKIFSKFQWLSVEFIIKKEFWRNYVKLAVDNSRIMISRFFYNPYQVIFECYKIT